MSLGEHPPLDALPRDMLGYRDVDLLIYLVNQRWQEIDRARGAATNQADHDSYLRQQREIETLQLKLDAYRETR